MSNVERRTITNDFEVRAAGGFTTITGYASVFNSLSQNLGGFVEQVAPGAFKKTILEADVRALFNHDPNYVLGRNKAGTLRMVEDAKGLAYEVDLPDTQQARDLAESMRRGDITQSSFGFRVIRDSWGVTADDYPLRTLEEVALYDVSPVTYPAYTEASSALRSLAKMSNTDIATLVDAGAAGELRAYIMGEVVTEERQIMVDRFSPRQELLYSSLETVVEMFGQFDQSTGPDGAHYAPASPYTSEGLACANCRFYEGPRGCELVAGDIDPAGICKMWIIPEDLLVGYVPAAPQEIDLEDPMEIPEQRGSSEEVDTALATASAETDGPDTVHLSSQEAQRRLRDAKAKELALRLRVASR
tara:strand:- start:10782 stop:11858 length:1077 start_codon:yes stop_codon:yes gene_type:complete